MIIVKTNQAGTLTIALGGKLDTISAPELDTVLRESLQDVTALVLDLKSLQYISSAGLRVLLYAQNVMNSKGSMVLTNVCESVMEVFEITGFVDILTIQ